MKSYRIYQELEGKYNEALETIKRLQTAVAFKDGLIRSLAAEIAMLPNTEKDEAQIQKLFEHAADAHAQASEHGSGTRPASRPGTYSSIDGTSEHDEPRGEAPLTPNQPADPVLAGIPSPNKRRKQ